MAVCLIRTAWAGTSGGPGVTQLAVREKSGTFITAATAQSAVDAMRAFWNSSAGYLPDEIILTVSPVVDGFDETNNALIGSTTAPVPPTAVAGTSPAVYAMPAGVKVNLNTTSIRYRRRVRGCFYIVPAAGTVQANNGMVTAASRTALQTNVKTLQTALSNANLDMVVWSRFDKKKPDRPGAVSLVTGLEVNEKMCVLRGRRD